jgi:hypothetical protein
MPRSYHLSLEIKEYDPAKEAEILVAIEKLRCWDGSPVEVDKDFAGINAHGQATLPPDRPANQSARQSEVECYEEICRDIWTVNGGYCRIYSQFAYLAAGNAFASHPNEYEEVMSPKGKKGKKGMSLT